MAKGKQEYWVSLCEKYTPKKGGITVSGIGYPSQQSAEEIVGNYPKSTCDFIHIGKIVKTIKR